MDVTELIVQLEQCKTTKAAKKILDELNIETEERFGCSYMFEVDGEKYNVVKHKYDDTCHVVHYVKKKSKNDGTRVVPMCYGVKVRI